jgi:hypothetical protein
MFAAGRDLWRDDAAMKKLVLSRHLAEIANGLTEQQPLLKTEWIASGALVVPYGTMSAVELSLTDIMDKIVVDDWGQCRKGLPFGALRQHVDSGRLHEGNLHTELGQNVAGKRPGRASDDETILLWHRGLSITDIGLGHAMLTKANGMKIGQVALGFGADDMGSIMIEENVVSAAGTTYRATTEDFVHYIRNAGFRPRQRDTLYRTVREYAAA